MTRQKLSYSKLKRISNWKIFTIYKFLFSIAQFYEIFKSSSKLNTERLYRKYHSAPPVHRTPSLRMTLRLENNISFKSERFHCESHENFLFPLFSLHSLLALHESESVSQRLKVIKAYHEVDNGKWKGIMKTFTTDKILNISTGDSVLNVDDDNERRHRVSWVGGKSRCTHNRAL